MRGERKQGDHLIQIEGVVIARRSMHLEIKVRTDLILEIFNSLGKGVISRLTSILFNDLTLMILRYCEWARSKTRRKVRVAIRGRDGVSRASCLILALL